MRPLADVLIDFVALLAMFLAAALLVWGLVGCDGPVMALLA